MLCLKLFMVFFKSKYKTYSEVVKGGSREHWKTKWLKNCRVVKEILLWCSYRNYLIFSHGKMRDFKEKKKNWNISSIFKSLLLSIFFQSPKWSRNTAATSSQRRWCHLLSTLGAQLQEWIESSILLFFYYSVTDCSEVKKKKKLVFP